jgi:hypothetical protein
MSNTNRYNFKSRLHEFVQHTGDLSAYFTETGTYSPLTYWEKKHWQREFDKKNSIFHTNITH